MKKGEKCERCGADTTDRWDYYITNLEYNEGILVTYESEPGIKRICQVQKCRHINNYRYGK